jgi:hypothetical protein
VCAAAEDDRAYQCERTKSNHEWSGEDAPNVPSRPWPFHTHYDVAIARRWDERA